MLVDAVYVTEQTGHVEKAFSKMAVLFDTKVTTRRRIMQASIYPVFVLCILICAILAVSAVFDHLAIAAIFIAAIFGIIILILLVISSGKTLSRKNMMISNVLI
ncbi:MAG: type II secretion system F family protein, partial [Lachnospiraceae bacterium]|nr:type II secretion system F family protein [Lachnospiraceae bacterium]